MFLFNIFTLYREVLSLGEEFSSVSLLGLSMVGDVHGGVVNVCSDVDEETDVKLLLLIDRADVSSRREIESITSVERKISGNLN